MSSEEEEEEAEEGQSEVSGKKSVKGTVKKYVPPRLVPVHYGMNCGCCLCMNRVFCVLCKLLLEFFLQGKRGIPSDAQGPFGALGIKLAWHFISLAHCFWILFLI